MRLHIGLLGLAALVGCGGDSSAPKEPTYPAVGGTYTITGGFDGLTAQEANFTGTVSIGQASREHPELTGSLNVTATVNGDVFLIAEPLQGATITPAGVLSLAIIDPSGQWSFSGNMSGTAASGRHTLTNGTDNISGNWSMQRSGNLLAERSNPATARDVGAMFTALARVSR